jgi:hypothetical protein
VTAESSFGVAFGLAVPDEKDARCVHEKVTSEE